MRSSGETKRGRGRLGGDGEETDWRAVHFERRFLSFVSSHVLAFVKSFSIESVGGEAVNDAETTSARDVEKESTDQGRRFDPNPASAPSLAVGLSRSPGSVFNEEGKREEGKGKGEQSTCVNPSRMSSSALFRLWTL